MCNCGCNTCETKKPALMLNESLAPRAILSEGLNHHLNANKPLTDHLYRAGSTAYFNLWAEARSYYSRGIIDITNEDDLAVLTETNLGHFGMFEGKKVPLDFPMLNESYDYDEVAQSESINESKIPTQDQVDKFFALTQNEMHYLYSKPVRGQEKTFNKMEVEPWDEYDLSNWNALVRKAKFKDQVNESDSDYPDFDLNKNIRYQDTSISSGMWRYTGKEQGGKGVYRNLNNGQILGFDRSDFDIFKTHLSSHFDISESLNEKLKGIDGKACWKGYKLSGTKKKNGKTVDNCVPMEEVLKEKEGVPHYTKDGKEWKGKLHKMPDGSLMSGNPHDKNGSGPNGESEKLYHKEDLKEDRKYNQEELLRLDLIARRRFDCDYKNCTDEQKAEVLKDKVKVGVKEALQEAKKEIDEAEFKGKEVSLGKPKRGGPKAYYVYVKDGDKVKKVTFGSGGLRAKINDKKARNAFAARHKCSTKKDKTKAGYWSCRLPRYAKLLGLKSNFSGFW